MCFIAPMMGFADSVNVESSILTLCDAAWLNSLPSFPTMPETDNSSLPPRRCLASLTNFFFAASPALTANFVAYRPNVFFTSTQYTCDVYDGERW